MSLVLDDPPGVLPRLSGLFRRYAGRILGVYALFNVIEEYPERMKVRRMWGRGKAGCAVTRRLRGARNGCPPTFGW